MFSYSFVFSKKGRMIYISHLDLMRLLTRALRRAGLPLKMTQGFNPHPKLSMKRALKLGVESEAEEAVVRLNEYLKPEEFLRKLNDTLPQGILITSVSLGG
jgi:radical SAM-linked protein